MPDQNLNIRPARLWDHLLINHVIEQAVMGWDLPERVKQLSVSSYYYQEYDFEHFRILVAEIGNEIVGVVAWEMQPILIQENKKALVLHGLFVDPKHHKKGIGTRLFQFFEKAAQKEQCDGLIVRAQKDAEGFFLHLGMKKLDVVDDRRDYAHRYWKSLK
jgi:predicted N-acetyltransferase YhbS